MRSHTQAMTNMTDLVARLSTVGLGAISEALDDFLARATKGRWSPAQILEEIARLEEIHRTKRSLEGRLQRARIGRFKSIADFDWNWPKKIERDLIERALTLEFMPQGQAARSARAETSRSLAAMASARPCSPGTLRIKPSSVASPS